MNITKHLTDLKHQHFAGAFLMRQAWRLSRWCESTVEVHINQPLEKRKVLIAR